MKKIPIFLHEQRRGAPGPAPPAVRLSCFFRGRRRAEHESETGELFFQLCKARPLFGRREPFVLTAEAHGNERLARKIDQHDERGKRKHPEHAGERDGRGALRAQDKRGAHADPDKKERQHAQRNAEPRQVIIPIGAEGPAAGPLPFFDRGAERLRFRLRLRPIRAETVAENLEHTRAHFLARIGKLLRDAAGIQRLVRRIIFCPRRPKRMFRPLARRLLQQRALVFFFRCGKILRRGERVALCAQLFACLVRLARKPFAALHLFLELRRRKPDKIFVILLAFELHGILFLQFGDPLFVLFRGGHGVLGQRVVYNIQTAVRPCHAHLAQFVLIDDPLFHVISFRPPEQAGQPFLF